MNRQHVESARGTLGVGPDGAFQIQFIRHLPIPPEKAWLWLTDPQRLQRWLPGCSLPPHIGGHVSFDFGEEGVATGEVTGLRVPDLGAGYLEHTWVWEGVPASVVTWSLEPDDDGKATRLTLLHRELIEEPAREFALGWHMMLDALALDVQGEPTDAAWEAGETLAGIYLPS